MQKRALPGPPRPRTPGLPDVAGTVDAVVVLVEVVVVGEVDVVGDEVVVVLPWCRYHPDADAGATVAASEADTTASVATNAVTLPRYQCFRRCVSWDIGPPRSVLRCAYQ
jgi:hypothetical protein